jgi:transposase
MLVAALRSDGLTAPYVIDGAMDGPSFLAYVEQMLMPTLNEGDIVFMDNLRTHKIDGVREVIEAAGAKVRYLPAYSPDLNPIEQAFSKLKAALRKGAARTVKTLLKLIGKLVRKFAPEEYANYFRHAGYRLLQRPPLCHCLARRGCLANALRRWLPLSTASAISPGRTWLRACISIACANAIPITPGLLDGVRQALAPDCAGAANLTPRYNPWK